MRLMQAISGLSPMLLCSCASIMVGNDSSIEVDSVPSGVAFTTNYAGMEGVTPAKLNVPNGDVLEVSFVVPAGFQQMEYTSEPSMSGWIVGNILFGNVVGLAIDFINDDSRTHNDIRVELVPMSATEAHVDLEVIEEEPAPEQPEA